MAHTGFRILDIKLQWYEHWRTRGFQAIPSHEKEKDECYVWQSLNSFFKEVREGTK